MRWEGGARVSHTHSYCASQCWRSVLPNTQVMMNGTIISFLHRRNHAAWVFAELFTVGLHIVEATKAWYSSTRSLGAPPGNACTLSVQSKQTEITENRSLRAPTAHAEKRSQPQP